MIFVVLSNVVMKDYASNQTICVCLCVWNAIPIAIIHSANFNQFHIPLLSVGNKHVYYPFLLKSNTKDDFFGLKWTITWMLKKTCFPSYYGKKYLSNLSSFVIIIFMGFQPSSSELLQCRSSQALLYCLPCSKICSSSSSTHTITTAGNFLKGSSVFQPFLQQCATLQTQTKMALFHYLIKELSFRPLYFAELLTDFWQWHGGLEVDLLLHNQEAVSSILDSSTYFSLWAQMKISAVNSA